MENHSQSATVVATENAKLTPQEKPKRMAGQGKADKAKLHTRPVPLTIYPIPVFIPHNPLCLLQIAYVIVRDYFSPPSSHPATLYRGHFSPATRSVHVTDPATIRALWEMGFFGKGSLSRSEPNWLDFERRRLGLVAFETVEEAIGRRRKERENFKLERARLEREALEAQRRKEAGILDEGQQQHDHKSNSNDAPARLDSKSPEVETKPDENINGHVALMQQTIERDRKHQPVGSAQSLAKERAEELIQSDIEPTNQEHLQLSLDEAFYLSYSLGALEIIDPASGKAITEASSLLKLFRQNSYFPPALSHDLKPDDPFLLSYVVYHHFRSLGWVVRDGIKFAADYLIYERGPVFTHAAFAIIIVPSYTDPYWSATAERVKYVEKKKAKKSWHWLHCINRVQNHVVKTLVLAYVDVPSPKDNQAPDADKDIGMLLRSYKVREFSVQRWSANRNRD